MLCRGGISIFGSMELELKRPIVFFDLETTGVDVVKDRIVEMSLIKIHPNGEEETHTWLVNPERPIPPEVTAVHGIKDEDVADKPVFKDLAHRVFDLIKDADLAGYNSNKFDIPLLAEEFLRAGIDFEMNKRVAVDVQNIFHRIIPGLIHLGIEQEAAANVLQIDRFPGIRHVADNSHVHGKANLLSFPGFLANGFVPQLIFAAVN